MSNCSSSASKVEQTINLLNSLTVQCPDIPVIYQKRDWDEGEYIYPQGVLDQILIDNKCSFISFKRQKEKIEALKLILDEYLKGVYPIQLVHIGLYIINRYAYLHEIFAGKSAEKSIGQKRLNILIKSPKFRVISNDEFIMFSWHAMARKVGDENINPSLNKIRLLIDSELFSDFTGIHYYDADMVEPISHKEFGECRTFTSEKDPMSEQVSKSNDGYIVGEIYLGRDIGGFRHFVDEVPLHCNSRIEVKFGDGWIPGRYECSLSAEDKRILKCSSRGEYFTIPEGSMVRIKK